MDKRVRMCNEINFCGKHRGDFVPCIGIKGEVNYVYKNTKVTLSADAFARLYEATMELYRAFRAWAEVERRWTLAFHEELEDRFLISEIDREGMAQMMEGDLQPFAGTEEAETDGET